MHESQSGSARPPRASANSRLGGICPLLITNSSFPNCSPPLSINTLMDANVQDEAEMLVESQLIASGNEGKQMGMQKVECQAHWVRCNIVLPLYPLIRLGNLCRWMYFAPKRRYKLYKRQETARKRDLPKVRSAALNIPCSALCRGMDALTALCDAFPRFRSIS